MRLLKIILIKEFKTLIREKTFIILSLVVISLSALALSVGFLSYRQQQEQIEYQQNKKRAEWMDQGDKHPHIAAHYGTFAFKPKTVLSILDFGLDAYTGTSVYLEAHYQHEFMFRPAQDHTSMIRFGELSMSRVLQVLLPLMVIFVGFSAFTTEKERGTFKLMISQGVPVSKLIWGKILSQALMITTILAPAFILTIVLTVFLSDQNVIGDLLIRLISFFVLYGIYLFIFISLTVLVSLWSSSGRTSLLSLLAIWIFFTFIIPKTTANLGENFFPLPSMREFKAAKEADMITGIPGMDDRKTYNEKLKNKNLSEYKVDSVHKMPINYDGIRQQSGEEYANKVHDFHLEKLRRQIHKQNNTSGIISLINPYLSIRNLSMMICGTDLRTATDFEDKAESYRRNLVKKMNEDMALNSNYGDFFEYKASATLWKNIKDFSYQLPLMRTLVQYYPYEISAIILWLFISILLIWIAEKKLRYLHD